MPEQKQTTEVRRNEIARAALEIISAGGMKNLSMVAISEKVGIVPSGIYRHYRGKDAILDAILDYIKNRFSANVHNASSKGSNAIERLHALLRLHVTLIRENEALPTVIFSNDIYMGNPIHKAKLLGVINGLLTNIATLVEQGQREGSLRKDIEPSTVAVSFLGLIQPSVILWHLDPNKFDIMKQAEAAWPMFCRAIANPSTARQKPNVKGKETV